MNDCRDVGRHLSAYVDGELGREEAQRVVSHLASCPLCREEAADLERVKRLLARESRPAMPEWLAARIEDEGLSRLAAARPLRRFWALGAGAALVAALAVLGVLRRALEEPVPISLFLAEHSRTLSRTVLVRRTAALAAHYQTEYDQN